MTQRPNHPTTQPPLDVFTLGETMVRFTPKGFVRLEEAAELELRVGGTESNVAVALARLGLRVSWASKLPRNPLGELTARRLELWGGRLPRTLGRRLPDGALLHRAGRGPPLRAGAV